MLRVLNGNMVEFVNSNGQVYPVVLWDSVKGNALLRKPNTESYIIAKGISADADSWNQGEYDYGYLDGMIAFSKL